MTDENMPRQCPMCNRVQGDYHALDCILRTDKWPFVTEYHTQVRGILSVGRPIKPVPRENNGPSES